VARERERERERERGRDRCRAHSYRKLVDSTVRLGMFARFRVCAHARAYIHARLALPQPLQPLDGKCPRCGRRVELLQAVRHSYRMYAPTRDRKSLRYVSSSLPSLARTRTLSPPVPRLSVCLSTLRYPSEAG
jgi:hypothetical protein